MNDIRQELHECVMQHNFFGKNISHEEFYHSSSLIRSSDASEPRPLTDLVTMTVWTTNTEAIQDFAFLSINEQPLTFHISFPPGSCSAMHTHKYIELMFVLEGKATQNINGEKVEFSKGEICLVNPDVKHCEYFYAQDCTVFWLGIDDVFLDKYEKSEDPFDYSQNLKKLINQKRSQYLYIRFSPISDTTYTNEAFLTIFHEMLQNLPGKKRLIIGYAERIVDLLTKEYHIGVSQKDRKELHKALVTDICDYIADNYPDASVKKIASIYHYSPDYLNRIFVQQTGKTISTYIQKKRMEHALQLLGTTNLSVEYIAEQCGYHNMGFFYKKFKDFYFTTPDAARKQY